MQFKGNFEVYVTSESETFVETSSTKLTCNYNYTDLFGKPVNALNITTNYIWERNGYDIADDDLNFEKDGKYLTFKHLDQQKHNGSYNCSVRLINSQEV